MIGESEKHRKEKRRRISSRVVTLSCLYTFLYASKYTRVTRKSKLTIECSQTQHRFPVQISFVFSFSSSSPSSWSSPSASSCSLNRSEEQNGRSSFVPKQPVAAHDNMVKISPRSVLSNDFALAIECTRVPWVHAPYRAGYKRARVVLRKDRRRQQQTQLRPSVRASERPSKL